MILFHHPATHPQNTPIPLFIAYWRLLVVFDIWCWGGLIKKLNGAKRKTVPDNPERSPKKNSIMKRTPYSFNAITVPKIISAFA